MNGIDRLLWPIVSRFVLYVAVMAAVVAGIPVTAASTLPVSTLGSWLYLGAVVVTVVSAIVLHSSRERWSEWFESVTRPQEARPPLAKRFFELDDGVYYLVVAYDQKHAVEIMRSAGIEFTRHGVPYDVAMARGDMCWEELSPDEVAKHGRCHTQDDRGVIPLCDANIGEWFCSEW